MNRDIRLSKGLFRLLITLFTVCLFNYTAFAQFETATVLGSVRDANEAAVPNATVTLKNVATDIAQTTTTDGNGDYQFANVKIGNYQVTVEANGFNRTVADQINVTVNARQRVDLTLQVASAIETVVVMDAANPLQTDSSEVGQLVQRQQIIALPLNGRSYANLALLAPGVRESHTNSSIGGGGREAAFNVNGLRATMNNFLLDGIDNNAYGTSNQSFSSQVVQISPDAIAEFKVQTNTYSAEFGRSGGAVINASYRSGTNGFHGAAWIFNRNTVLNAVGFLNRSAAQNRRLIATNSALHSAVRSLKTARFSFWRLRRFSADSEKFGLLQHSDARAKTRNSKRGGSQSADRSNLRGGNADSFNHLCPKSFERTARAELDRRGGQQLSGIGFEPQF